MQPAADETTRRPDAPMLAAWRESESRRRPVASVTLDEGDDDAVVLWSHVVEALELDWALEHAGQKTPA